ncbi:MAG: hypothetical protein JNM76_09320 [Betaproteobacteria bacterium]|nr:hypothetical protein [Betaproteobacteria bacterium]
MSRMIHRRWRWSAESVGNRTDGAPVLGPRSGSIGGPTDAFAELSKEALR